MKKKLEISEELKLLRKEKQKEHYQKHKKQLKYYYEHRDKRIECMKIYNKKKKLIDIPTCNIKYGEFTVSWD